MESACAALYCHLWLVWLCRIVAHYLINRTIFRNEVSGHSICFDFLYNFEIFLIQEEMSEI